MCVMVRDHTVQFTAKKNKKKNRFRVENTDLRVSMPEALQHLQEHQVFTLFTVLNAFVSMAGNNGDKVSFCDSQRFIAFLRYNYQFESI